MQRGGCPISSRRFKTEIAYVNERDRRQISDEVAKLRVARYKCTDDPTGHPHLGFILEDAPSTPAADVQRERVDLYAYLSMVVAALQTQREQLDSQRREIEVLRSELKRIRRWTPVRLSVGDGHRAPVRRPTQRLPAQQGPRESPSF
jgi:hypothetical protein